jgi:hypothetical protein
VIVPRSVVVVVDVSPVVVAVLVVVAVVDVAVVLLVVVGAVLLEVVAVVDGVEVVVGTLAVVVESFPLSAATTASATPRPSTAEMRTAISSFMPPLIPPRGGSP